MRSICATSSVSAARFSLASSSGSRFSLRSSLRSRSASPSARTSSRSLCCRVAMRPRSWRRSICASWSDRARRSASETLGPAVAGAAARSFFGGFGGFLPNEKTRRGVVSTAAAECFAAVSAKSMLRRLLWRSFSSRLRIVILSQRRRSQCCTDRESGEMLAVGLRDFWARSSAFH